MTTATTTAAQGLPTSYVCTYIVTIQGQRKQIDIFQNIPFLLLELRLFVILAIGNFYFKEWNLNKYLLHQLIFQALEKCIGPPGL